MRFHELTRLDEAIVTRPRHLGTFVDNRIKDADRLLAEFAAIKAQVEAHEAGENLLRTFLRYGTDYADAADHVYDLVYLAKRPERYLPLENLRDNLHNFRTYGKNFLRYILSAFDHVDPVDERTWATLAILDTADKGAQDYGYEPGDGDLEYRDAMALRDALTRLSVALRRSLALWDTVKTKLGEVAKLSDLGDRYRPEHGEVETLYHATAFASEIVRDGFQAEKPPARRGLGNYGTQATISFTHDLKIAQDLMRALKDVWLIAHGQLTAKQIASWIEKEGLDAKQIEQSVGLAVEEPNEHPAFPPRRRLKRLGELMGPEETVKLYRVWLAHTKLRADPVFTYIEDTLALMGERDIKDIGVVACEVRLTPEDQYLWGESEFRLPADRVLAVKRVL